MATAKAAPDGSVDAWTWTALCADTKLIAGWMVDPRDGGIALDFTRDLAGRLAHKAQPTTDGHKTYLEAVEAAFGGGIDYAQLVKIYGDAPGNSPERKYSPVDCIGTKVNTTSGTPDMAAVSPS